MKNLRKKCMDYCNEKNMEKLYAIGLLILAVALILPMYIAGFYNVISHSDCFGHAQKVHLEWIHNPGLTGFIRALGAAFERMYDIYFGWGGNYTSFFFSALQPIAFSERLNFVGTFIFLTCFIIAEYRFLEELCYHQFALSKRTGHIIFLCLVILETQYLTSARQAFYWYSGCVTNTLGYAGALAIIRIMLKGIRENAMTGKTLIWGLFLAVFVGGCNYSTLVSLFVIILLIMLYLYFHKEISHSLKGKMILISLVLLLGGTISIIAPGNSLRQSLNTGTDAVTAIIMAIEYGKRMSDGTLWEVQTALCFR